MLKNEGNNVLSNSTAKSSSRHYTFSTFRQLPFYIYCRFQRGGACSHSLLCDSTTETNQVSQQGVFEILFLWIYPDL